MDVDGTGTVTPMAFYHSLLMLGVDCHGEEASALFRSLDNDGNGTLNYGELLSVLRTKRKAAPAPAPPAKEAAIKDAVTGAAHETSNSNVVVQVDAQVLGDAALDRDSEISLTEQPVDEEMRDGAAGEILVDAKNAIELRTGVGEQSRTLGTITLDAAGAGSLRSQLAEALATSWGRVSDLFSEWDADGTGMVDLKEFGKALRALGVNATAAQVKELFGDLDDDQSGQVSYRELYKALRHPSNAPEGGAGADPSAAGESTLSARARRPAPPERRPLVPVRDRLLDILPRVGPRLLDSLRDYAETDGTIERRYFVAGVLDTGSRPSNRIGPPSQTGISLFAELGSEGRDPRVMAKALDELFSELHLPELGDWPDRLPLSSIPARIRKLKAPSREPATPFPPLKGASPRVARAGLVAADEGLGFPWPPPALSHHEASLLAGEVLELHAKEAARQREAAARKQQQLAKLQAAKRASGASSARAPASKGGGGGGSVTLPPLPLSARARAQQRNGARLSANDVQLADFQKRGVALRSMMDSLMAEPYDPHAVKAAIDVYVHDASSEPTPRGPWRGPRAHGGGKMGLTA